MLSDRELADRIRAGNRVDQTIVDEYYQRCIPLYREFLGVHWHTPFFESCAAPAGPAAQERMIETVLEGVPLRPGLRVLDIGCGIGGTVAWLARRHGVESVGLTPVAAQRALAQESLRTQGLDAKARIDLGHAHALPYDDDSFDAVVFFESPCHFADRSVFFREACRVLRPGGELAGEDWLRTESVQAPGVEANDPGARLIEAVERTWAIPRLGTPQDYLAMIGQAGFESARFVDLRAESALHRAFAVTRDQQIGLVRQMQACQNPLQELTLEGMLRLGQAMACGAFTIGRFRARKPPTPPP